jgi:hypothetical protein
MQFNEVHDVFIMILEKILNLVFLNLYKNKKIIMLRDMFLTYFCVCIFMCDKWFKMQMSLINVQIFTKC